MRTKTMLLSALLGTLGSVSLMAQSTNVYSLNAVGYINVTVQPGYNIVSCPLIASPDNTLNTLLPNTAGQYKKWQFWGFSPSSGYKEEIGQATSWSVGGLSTLNPGQAGWLFNPGANPSNVTFVGTVPSGSLTNTLVASSFNLVSSILPTSGDLLTNPLMNFTTATKKDQVWQFTAGTGGGFKETVLLPSGWSAGDPQEATVGGGFFYFNASTAANNWVESFSVGQ
jgi:hypothetical protein